MIVPFQKTGKKKVGHEYVCGDEETIIAGMVTELKAQVSRVYQNKKMLRQIHTKMHGCVRGTFNINTELPTELQQGIFKPGIHYPAWIRFSNSFSTPRPDKKKDIRGIAIKLMNVPGEKLMSDERFEQTQDLLLMSSETFFSKDLEQFTKTLKAATAKNKLALLGYFLNPFHWKMVGRIMKSNIACRHPFSINYWSTQPYQYGDEASAVKYFMRPSQNNKLVYADDNDDNFLRINMAKTLALNGASFDFFIQFQTDAEKMPIEDPTVKWGSSYIKVAELQIPQQVFDSPEQMDFGDNLSFNPWHSLPEHRPLGSFNRARKRIYDELSRFRHQKNNLEVFEPKAPADFVKT